ncbi:23S rRNA pseudouridine2604 synthase [[Clostridium] fimetarium]|uniref:Pseudouridine synthase n=2 Tax=[Clostridium] fimetarium TaxID=99656 RepID=A0A1I0RGQ6_9FIRM|nr:23S rRNA pseudouridine2604 synthase [[Clostridium] fimetarium]
MHMEVRINKYLSEAGVCSRREADRLIEAGKVMIDGKSAITGSKVTDGQVIKVNGTTVTKEEELILLAFNKPVGVVCTTTDKQGKNNIVDYIGYEKRIYPVGRLDKDSQGLILMTNDGDIMNKILKSVNGHEKEYVVEVDKSVTEEFIHKMSNGIYLEALDRKTDQCFVKKEGKFSFRIILTQGLNRQIRRMSESLGYKVTRLERIRIMNIKLAGIPLGQYRKVSDEEYRILCSML